MEKSAIHRRLVTNTKPLIEELEKLGFREEEKITGKGINPIRVFRRGTKVVHTSFDTLILMVELSIGPNKEDHKGYSLQEIKDKMRIHYQGLTVHDEMLKFFANRNL
jgi:hypothetical protein